MGYVFPRSYPDGPRNLYQAHYCRNYPQVRHRSSHPQPPQSGLRLPLALPRCQVRNTGSRSSFRSRAITQGRPPPNTHPKGSSSTLSLGPARSSELSAHRTSHSTAPISIPCRQLPGNPHHLHSNSRESSGTEGSCFPLPADPSSFAANAAAPREDARGSAARSRGTPAQRRACGESRCHSRCRQREQHRSHC